MLFDGLEDLRRPYKCSRRPTQTTGIRPQSVRRVAAMRAVAATLLMAATSGAPTSTASS